MSEPAFELEDVAFRYRGAARPALQGVTLRIRVGAHTTLVGPNGAGKSTLLRLLLGILRPARGKVRFRGREPRAWGRRELARRVGVVSQEPPPELPLTVGEFVGMGRNPWLRPWEGMRARDHDVVARALDRTDLGGLAGRPISAVSGGELQRAKLARALAQEPRVLVLDEPTAHLDLGHEMRIFELVRSLVRDEGMTAVSVTHNLGLASRFADRLGFVREGRLEAEGSPGAVLRAEIVGRAFGWPVEVVDLGELGRQVVPLSTREER